MSSRSPKARRFALIVTAVAVVCAALAPAALSKATVSFKRIGGYASAGTPAKYNKVGILKVGLEEGAQRAGPQPRHLGQRRLLRAARARTSSTRATGWQVWAVERRENLLEDHSVLDRAKAGKASRQELFNYYLGFINDPSVANALPVRSPDASVGYAQRVGDAHRDRGPAPRGQRAKQRGGKVVVGGHSLGGTITTAYATWDFKGKAGRARAVRARVHRRRQQARVAHRRGGHAGARRSGRRPPWLHVRRHPRAVRGPVQRHRLARRAQVAEQ